MKAAPPAAPPPERASISVGVAAGVESAPLFVALTNKARSGFKTTAGLKGKRIAVSNLIGLGSLTVLAMLEREGLDRNDVVLVEAAYGNMADMLERGEVAAALLAEPYVAANVNRGRVRVLQEALTREFRTLPTAGWMATGEWVRDNPRTLAAFRRALAKAQRLIKGDLGQAVFVIPTYVKAARKELNRVALGSFPAELDVQGLQVLADVTRRYGFLEKDLDVRTIVE